MWIEATLPWMPWAAFAASKMVGALSTPPWNGEPVVSDPKVRDTLFPSFGLLGGGFGLWILAAAHVPEPAGGAFGG